MRRQSWLHGAVLGMALQAAMLACAICTAAADAPDTRPIVIFREDDIRVSWRTPFQGLGGMSGLEYGKLKRIPITWGIITSAAISGGGLSWSELKDYIDTAGGELASHSVSHQAMPDAQAYINELINSKAIIEQNVPGYACSTFLQPGVWTDDALLDDPAKLDNPIGQAIQANYGQSQAYLGRGWHVGRPHYKYGKQATWSIDYEQPTVEAVQATLDAVAATPGLLFVIACHGVKEGVIGDKSAVRADVLKAAMDQLALLRDLGKIRLMTMHEAYHANLPDDLNGIVDPSFEMPTLPATAWPIWTLSGGAQVSDHSASDGQKCVVIPKGGQAAQYELLVPPGRYVLKWKQKLQGGAPLPRELRCYAQNRLNRSSSQYAVCGPQVFSSPGAWEQKSVLLLVKEGLPSLDIFFPCYADATFLLDEVSLVKTPVDPAVSVSNSAITPSPAACTVSWRTADDQAVAYVDIRVGSRAHPQSNTNQEGRLVARVAAIPGTVQQTTQPIDWSQQNPGAYFSLFAVRNDGSCSAPDAAVLFRDPTPPSRPQVSVQANPNSSASASWSSCDAESGVYRYRYAIGTTPGSSDVRGWETCNSTAVTLTSLPLGIDLFISVQAQNAFGCWSDTGSAGFRVAAAVASDIASALSQPDGRIVALSGRVTAVLGDCIYIQQSDAPRGIRVVGGSAYVEGQTITVVGTMATVNGERSLLE